MQGFIAFVLGWKFYYKFYLKLDFRVKKMQI